MTYAARTHLHSLDEIGDALRARSLDLCYALKLQGRYEPATREFVALNPLRNDRSLGSFRIVCEGAKQGLIKDFAGSGQSWSWLGFIAELWFGNDKARAVEWAKRFLGLDGGDPDALRKTARAIVARKEEASTPSDLDKRKRGYAFFLYTDGSTKLYAELDDAKRGIHKGALLDTPVYRYLKGRGIDLARWPGPLRGLRFHPDLHHAPSCWCKGDYQAKRGPDGAGHVHYPAMLAAINSANGEFLALHRTFLQVQPDKSVTKAPVGKDAKLCLGRYAGGMIRLWNGIRVDADTGEVKAGVKLGAMAKRIEAGRGEKIELHLTEGIEDALTIAQRFPAFTVGAGVSISNMGGIAYPPAVGRVVFWRDNDGAGSQADQDFAKVIANAQRQGLAVRVVTPPAGFKDVNAVLQAQETAEGAA